MNSRWKVVKIWLRVPSKLENKLFKIAYKLILRETGLHPELLKSRSYSNLSPPTLQPISHLLFRFRIMIKSPHLKGSNTQASHWKCLCFGPAGNSSCFIHPSHYSLESSLCRDLGLLLGVGRGQSEMNGNQSPSSKSRFCESQRAGGGRWEKLKAAPKGKTLNWKSAHLCLQVSAQAQLAAGGQVTSSPERFPRDFYKRILTESQEVYL